MAHRWHAGLRGWASLPGIDETARMAGLDVMIATELLPAIERGAIEGLKDKAE